MLQLGADVDKDIRLIVLQFYKYLHVNVERLRKCDVQ